MSDCGLFVYETRRIERFVVSAERVWNILWIILWITFYGSMKEICMIQGFYNRSQIGFSLILFWVWNIIILFFHFMDKKWIWQLRLGILLRGFDLIRYLTKVKNEFSWWILSWIWKIFWVQQPLCHGKSNGCEFTCTKAIMRWNWIRWWLIIWATDQLNCNGDLLLLSKDLWGFQLATSARC